MYYPSAERRHRVSTLSRVALRTIALAGSLGSLLLTVPLAGHAQSRPPAVTGQVPARQTIDVAVTIVSSGTAPDEISIAYGEPTAEEQIKQDFRVIASELATAPPVVKVQQDQASGFTTGDARIPGLVNWKAGTVNLDALVQGLKRYGHFRVLCFFQGNFPMPTPGQIVRPPLRIETAVSGGLVDYRIWIDQSRGVPKSVPSVKGNPGPDWKLMLGLAALAIVAAAGVFLIVNVILAQRQPKLASRAREEKS